LDSLAGHTVTLEGLCASGRPVLLVFSDPACGPCAALFPDIARWDREHGDLFTVAVISRGAADLNRARLGEHRLKHVLLQQEVDVAAAYGSTGTPSAVLVRPDGTIGSAPTGGSAAIRELVTTILAGQAGTAAETPAPAAALKTGDPAPGFTLPDLDGRAVSLSGLLGRPALIVFWNPGCGYCRRMLRHLQQWEAVFGIDGPRLLVVSTGGVEENRAQRLPSPVLLDADFSVGRLYGAQGTPSAALVDREGRVTRELVVGAPDILSAAGFRPGAGLPREVRPNRRGGIDDELLSDGSMIVYSAERKRAYTLNGTAALVWESCDGELTIGDIVAEVQSVFPSAADAEGDVLELLDRFVDDGLIDLSTSAAPERLPVPLGP
jgi:thiol-disulfide isomerase/thioredoxin